MFMFNNYVSTYSIMQVFHAVFPFNRVYHEYKNDNKIIIIAHFYNKMNFGKISVFYLKMNIDSYMYNNIVQK